MWQWQGQIQPGTWRKEMQTLHDAPYKETEKKNRGSKMKQRPQGFIMIVAVILLSKKMLARKTQGTLSVILVDQSKK